ncbi:uncharacterized protein METZ01_LOCUS111503 [marine metagenome]|uniref:NadR/Ttd14 AAA domain-containing protein n=1 Tax=marine metagenome TaxID=408172 RepID=A0A381X1J5_9ZZZZ|tara:strand:+ start:359 stop:970 length:612 start_codon:yes stop_codon:yes gene_type:complete
MRVVVVGCEYTGVTTLIDGIYEWGNARGIHHHLDDHFTIPDGFHLSREEQGAMLEMLPAIKERFQRFQMVYHVRLLHLFEHILMGGFHIEEMVYGPKYYYPGINIDVREYEPEMPDDTILVHLTATADVVRTRMQSDPHTHQLVPSEDVTEILERFEEEVRHSWIKHKMKIDSSHLTPEKLVSAFLEASKPHLNTRDMLARMT